MLGRLTWSARQRRWCSNQIGLDEATEYNKDTVDAYASSLQVARCLGYLSDHVLNHAIMHVPAQPASYRRPTCQLQKANLSLLSAGAFQMLSA